MNLLFMGTQDFALEILRALDEARDPLDKLSVVTQPDKPSGRGYKIKFDCVKQYALDRGLDIYQPQSLKDGSFDETLTKIDPSLIVVASYGKILPAKVIDYPEFGCVNVHASLLPAYRGAAPINRAVMAGEKETGVTLMYMDEGLDTGDMIAKASVEIGDMTAGELRDKLAALGGDLLKEYYPKLIISKLPTEKQDPARATYAAKITPEDRPIDFTKSAEEIAAQIRGLSPNPGAVCKIASSGLSLKILDARAHKLPGEISGVPGELADPKHFGKNTVTVITGDGALKLLKLQPEGGKVMDAASLVNGRKLCYPDKLI